jgi:DNA end-binding protein Ku
VSARAIASGTVSFGLVSIPIKLYSATQPKAGISFNLLHKDCGSRLKQSYMCPKHEAKVERADMVKGYEFAKDQYVIFTPEELKALEEEASQAIEITEFVPAEQIDTIYFDKPYYMAPDKGGSKAYRLLAEAMEKTGRVALAKYAARGKQYLVMLRPHGNRLIMQQLLYADEVRAESEVPIDEAPPVREAELKLAVQVIDQISRETFDPSSYEDEARKRIEAAVQQKVEGQEISIAPVEGAPAQVIDLMEALKASLSKRAPERIPAKRAPEKAASKRARSQSSKK